MADLGSSTWSEIDASNNAVPPNGWPEGMAPSDVNNSARAQMGGEKRWWDRSNATQTTTGTSTAYVLTYAAAESALYDGEETSFVLHTTCGATPTLNRDGLGAKFLRRYDFATDAFISVAAGDIRENQVIRVRYNLAADRYDIISVSIAPGDFVATNTDNVFTGTNTFEDTVTMDGAAFNEAKGADIASASTIDLTAATGNVVDLTGTTTVNAITLAEGAERTVRTTGALTFTNGASLVLPSGANILTAAGDYWVFRGYAAGVVRMTGYQLASGRALKGSVLQMASSTLGTYSLNVATIPIDNTKPQSSEGTEFFSQAFTPLSATSKIVVDVTLVMACTSAPDTAAIALFQDSGTDAIAANPCNLNGFADPKTLTYQVTSGSTTARTFKVRAGCNTNPLLINGVNGVGAVMNGLCASSITITEYAL